MKTLDASITQVDTNLHELVVAVVDLPLHEFAKAGALWLLPHRAAKMPTGFTWAADNIVPHLRKYLGAPPFETIFEKWRAKENKHPTTGAPQLVDVPGIYDLGIQPFEWGADQLVSRCLEGAKILVFDEKDPAGLVMAQMEDWCINQGLVLDDALRARRLAAAPSSLVSMLTGSVGGRQVLTMGWKNTSPYFEVRYWNDPQKIESLKSCQGRLVFSPVKGHSRDYCKVFVHEGTAPKADVLNWDDIECAPVTFVRPVDEDATYTTISTVLNDMDELFIPRTHCFGKVTIGDLKSYLGKKLNGPMGNSEEMSKTLGAYYRKIEPELVACLEPPRTVVNQGPREDMPEVAFLANVQQAGAQVWEEGSDRGLWLLNLLCRVAVVMHSRHGTIFDENFTSKLFEPEQLIWSIIRSKERDTASYLAPMILVAPLMRPKKDHVLKAPAKAGGAKNPFSGVDFNDLFR